MYGYANGGSYGPDGGNCVGTDGNTVGIPWFFLCQRLPHDLIAV